MSLKFDKSLKIRLGKSLKIYIFLSFIFRKKVFNSASKKKSHIGLSKSGDWHRDSFREWFRTSLQAHKDSRVVQKKLNESVASSSAWFHDGLWSIMAPENCPARGDCILVCVQSLQSCLTLCNPLDYSPPSSSVHGILQARILEWVAMPSSRESSQPGVQTCISCIAGGFFYLLSHLACPESVLGSKIFRWWWKNIF